ncbi:MAG: response regulator [Pseudanabaenaceae cyanobacterium bins.68]|nr:response regulator [Pseudanabaenaceae cyanobacterium bins.68]
MQGNLREIDARSLIRLLEAVNSTGELVIELPQGKQWLLFLVQGAIVYATDSPGARSCLVDYLAHYLPELREIPRLPLSSEHLPEYAQIWMLLEQELISVAIAKQILEAVILEVLFDLMPLGQGSFNFESTPPLSPRLVSLRFSEYESQLTHQRLAWHRFYPQFHSPHQCLAWRNPGDLVPDDLADVAIEVNGINSLRQLSRRSGQDLISLTQQLHQAWQEGALQILPIASSPSTKTKQMIRIVCIDDSITVCRTVEYILHHAGYQITGITNPTRALSLIFQLRPSLIFCDIEMPELNGYELCTMLRKSPTFAYTPIVMLTGRDQFLDRVQARRAGATEYLTKPFGEQELLAIAEKYS